MSDARCPLVREIEEACDRFADKPLGTATLGEDHARFLVAVSVWWHDIRAALEAAEEMAKTQTKDHASFAAATRYRAATRKP